MNRAMLQQCFRCDETLEVADRDDAGRLNNAGWWYRAGTGWLCPRCRKIIADRDYRSAREEQMRGEWETTIRPRRYYYGLVAKAFLLAGNWDSDVAVQNLVDILHLKRRNAELLVDDECERQPGLS